MKVNTCYQFLKLNLLLVLLPLLTMSVPPIANAQVYDYKFDGREDNLKVFPQMSHVWGQENLSYLYDKKSDVTFMRVFVPRGAIDPGSMKKRGLPRGGAGFKTKVFSAGVSHALLSYSVRFPENFNFVRGGKLPGLYGGLGNSGGNLPNGTDGFSFRLMWGKNGKGSVYAYLPTSTQWGTGLLRHQFGFIPGRWHRLTQELILNDVGLTNGKLRMWIDGKFIGEDINLKVRSVERLLIDGMFFEVFFGGNDDSWAAKDDTYIDFKDVVLRGY